MWDTYRALHLWFNLVHQDINADIANSMLAHYDKSVDKSLSYQTLIDPETKYMRGRDSEGNWRTPFVPIAYQGPASVSSSGKTMLYQKPVSK